MLQLVRGAYPQARLKHLVRFESGGTPRVEDPSNWAEGQDGVPWVTIGDMTGRTNVTETARCVSHDGLRAARLKVADPPILLFSMYASLGQTALLHCRGCWNQAILGIVPGGNIDERFLHYALSALRPYLMQLARSNTQHNLNQEQVGNLLVPNPPLTIQQLAADYLDRETARIAELIHKKRGLAALLREQLDSRISLLSAHEDSEWIPLSRYLESMTQGYSPVCESHPADEREWGVLKLSAVDRGTFRPHENKALPGAEEARREYEVREGDVLVTRSNTPDLVGDVCVVREDRPKLLLPDLIYRVDLRKDAFDPRFLTYFLLGRRIRGLISAVARGSSRSMVKLRGEDIGSIRVPCPPMDEQHRIADELDHHAEMADRAREALSAQVDRLMERRQALITAAVTGQIDIGKAA